MTIIFVLFLGLIIYISFNNTFLNPYLFEGADKIKHLLAFFVLSFLFFYSFKSINTFYKIAVLIFFAVGIEILQSFTKRESSVEDFLFSVFGVVLFLVLWKYVKK